MSSTTGRVRRHCQYFTTDALADVLVSMLGVQPFDRILEPHVGGGAFVRAALRQGVLRHQINACDVDLTLIGDVVKNYGIMARAGDFLTLERATFGPDRIDGWDWIIGNPPYSRPSGRFNEKGEPIQEPCAELHIRHALSLLAPGGHLAFLLRLAMLETSDRIGFWREHPAKCLYVLAQRPSFTDGGTDSSAYGWFIWERDWRPERTASIVGDVRLLDWRAERC